MNQLENNQKTFFHGMIMLRFEETKIAKEECYAAKKPIKPVMLIIQLSQNQLKQKIVLKVFDWILR